MVRPHPLQTRLRFLEGRAWAVERLSTKSVWVQHWAEEQSSPWKLPSTQLVFCFHHYMTAQCPNLELS